MDARRAVRRSALIVALGLVSPLLLSASSVAASAAPQGSTVRVSATLLARGAAVQVDATVRCRASLPAQATLVVQITQRSQKVVTGGGSVANFECTGAAQRVRLYVSPYLGMAPFRAKDAFVASDLQVLSPDGAELVSARETVTITR